VGASVTLKLACELVITVRVVLPAVAVIVTEVAFVDCHVNVTLCPEVIVTVFAENTIVGFAGGGGVVPPPPLELLEPPQALSPRRASKGSTDATRLEYFLIMSVPAPPIGHLQQFQMPLAAHQLSK
jgi:hypothetical protein